MEWLARWLTGWMGRWSVERGGGQIAPVVHKRVAIKTQGRTSKAIVVRNCPVHILSLYGG